MNDLRPLGHSGLLVSPLTLGTMTMGGAGWGSDDLGSAAVLDRYLESGGNALDTADGGPVTGGSGRANMTRAVEGSLRRLRTDRIDLYWMHLWDGFTPADEALRGMVDLVASGKIVHYGLSNVPAWFATARQGSITEQRGAWTPGGRGGA